MHSSTYGPHWELYPRVYVAPQVHLNSITIDGNLNKAPWNDPRVPWSETFRDIQGTGSHDRDHHIPVTQFKAVWDEENLYVAGILNPAQGIATEAHFTERNSPIYQRDSDFEVFLDPTGTTHGYKELEVNAINTVWNLLLDKPYGDDGREHSGRIAEPGDDLYWDVSKQATAVRVLKGRLNDATNHGALWTVEMALSIGDVVDRCDPAHSVKPHPNSHWRVNFSRVEKEGDINWTWQSQTVWDPAVRDFAGKIQMHLPDSWGYLVFGTLLDAIGTDGCDPPRDPTWPHRLAAMNVYYALHFYKEQHGSYTTNIADLSLDQAIVEPFDIAIQCTDKSFLVTVRGRIDSIVSSVRDDRFLQAWDRELASPGR
jgi:hypothetical protein